MPNHPSDQSGGENDVWMTMQELADLLKVSYETVKKWNSQGSAPKRSQFGKHVRYLKADVQAWLNEHEAA